MCKEERPNVCIYLCRKKREEKDLRTCFSKCERERESDRGKDMAKYGRIVGQIEFLMFERQLLL